MTKLYINGRIKVNLIEDALLNARSEGKLRNISEDRIGDIAKAFEEKMKEFESKVGTQIIQKEVKFLIEQLKRNKQDRILDSEWRVIEEILLDKDFDLD
ncbi:MAG: hypothetical protein KAQ87_04255 [Candidatus Pacebacteria bacterium]|nr:hypothetical protein [Candidatus Paceibacterota bacterium]